MQSSELRQSRLWCLETTQSPVPASLLSLWDGTLILCTFAKKGQRVKELKEKHKSCVGKMWKRSSICICMFALHVALCRPRATYKLLARCATAAAKTSDHFIHSFMREGGIRSAKLLLRDGKMEAKRGSLVRWVFSLWSCPCSRMGWESNFTT